MEPHPPAPSPVPLLLLALAAAAESPPPALGTVGSVAGFVLAFADANVSDVVWVSGRATDLFTDEETYETNK